MTTGVFAIDTEACSAAILVVGEMHERFLIAPRRHSALILPMVEASGKAPAAPVCAYGLSQHIIDPMGLTPTQSQ